MTTTMRIAEVAEQVGVSTSTVRYYERLGVLPPAERAENSYRVYDERTVERLRFISRAKQLGCKLDEIADLVIAWDGGECGPVQDQLRALVADKLAAAQVEIVNLVTFTADLRLAAASLERFRPAGPCREGCGCITDSDPAEQQHSGASVSETTSTRTPVALSSKPRSGPAPDQPVACTLRADEIPGRVDDWTAVLSRATSRTAIAGGVRVELGPEVDLAAVTRLAVAEHDCCRFLSFNVTIGHQGVALEVTAPGDALAIVLALTGVPA